MTARVRGDWPGEAEATWRKFWGVMFRSGVRETPRESLRESLRQSCRESLNAKELVGRHKFTYTNLYSYGAHSEGIVNSYIGRVS